jgi:hypothetical protein
VKNHEARIQRLYDLAEKIGRLGAETQNLIDDLSAKIAARRTELFTPNRPAARQRQPRKRRSADRTD